MATNKHATIRYHALDRCFGNPRRKFFIEDLVKACNEAIFEFSGIDEGVKKRQVFDDISFMESEQGWSIPLDRIKEGKRVYYRYSEKDFSIKIRGITPSEANQLNETLAILSRFKGMPQFEWIEETQIRLRNTLSSGKNIQAIVGFEQNPYLKGLSMFTDAFNAIQHEAVCKISYKGYKQQEPVNLTFHPWYLKQYNSRWFLFGLNEEYETISNLALDRIISFKEGEGVYRPNNEINFDEYFEDVVGVTIKPDTPPEKVIIKIMNDAWPYIESKPFHGSQKKIKREESGVWVELSVQINHELTALLFSFMDSIEVLEPKELRERFKAVSKSMGNMYF